MSREPLHRQLGLPHNVVAGILRANDTKEGRRLETQCLPSPGSDVLLVKQTSPDAVREDGTRGCEFLEEEAAGDPLARVLTTPTMTHKSCRSMNEGTVKGILPAVKNACAHSGTG